jgi:hypothetical protein
VIDDRRVAFIMGDKLTHANIKQNPSAVFLFKADGPGYEGKRIYLRKESETADQDTISITCDREYPGVYCEPHYLQNTFLVTFSVEAVLPLVGEK